jgi:hypothetical protein
VGLKDAAAGDGSDAVNRGDYSATYVELRTGKLPFSNPESQAKVPVVFRIIKECHNDTSRKDSFLRNNYTTFPPFVSSGGLPASVRGASH